MPNTKQFEAFDLNEILFGSGKITKLSMVEISEIFFTKINEIYNFLEEGKVVSIEVPNHDCLYHLTRFNSDHYVLTDRVTDQSEAKHLTAIETVNWLFATAPFMAMVGYSNI
jgi:hypothetical protein